MMEIWKDVPGFNNLYQVSNLGNVRSVTRYKKVLKPWIDKDGYRNVLLKNRGVEKHFRVSRLVAGLFIPNPYGKEIVNHIDMKRDNDAASNLEWCTTKENVAHSYKHGKYIGHGHKSVSQFKDGVFIKSWPSISDASKALSIPNTNISKCLRGTRHKAGGYEWKFNDTRFTVPEQWEQIRTEGL